MLNAFSHVAESFVATRREKEVKTKYSLFFYSSLHYEVCCCPGFSKRDR